MFLGNYSLGNCSFMFLSNYVGDWMFNSTRLAVIAYYAHGGNVIPPTFRDHKITLQYI